MANLSSDLLPANYYNYYPQAVPEITNFLENSSLLLEDSKLRMTSVFSKHLSVLESLSLPHARKPHTKAGSRTARLEKINQVQETPEEMMEKVKRAARNEKRSKEDALLLYNYLDDSKFFKEFRQYFASKLNTSEALLYICHNLRYEQVIAGKIITEELGLLQTTCLIFTGEISKIVKMAIESQAPNYTQKKDSEYGLSSMIGSSCQPETQASSAFASEEKNQNQDKVIGTKKIPVGFAPENNILLKEKLKLAKLVSTPSYARARPSSRKTTKPVYVFNQGLQTMRDSMSRSPDLMDSVVTLKKGDYFGEFNINNSRNDDGLLVMADCELLLMSDELLSYVERRFDKTNSPKLNFFLDFFPGIRDPCHSNLLRELVFRSKEASFDANTYVTPQGNTSRLFYMLYKGTCDLYVKIEGQQLNELKKHDEWDGIHVCKLSPGEFIGEEILYNNESNYEFTVKTACPNVAVLVFDVKDIGSILTLDIVKAIKQAYLTKRQNYLSYASQYVKLHMTPLSVVKSCHNRISRSTMRESMRKEDTSQSSGLLNDYSLFIRKEPLRTIKASPTKSPIKPHIFSSNNKLPTTQLHFVNAMKRQILAKSKEKSASQSQESMSILKCAGNSTKDSTMSKHTRELSETSQIMVNQEGRASQNKGKVPMLNLQNVRVVNKETILKGIAEKLAKNKKRHVTLDCNTVRTCIVTDRLRNIVQAEEAVDNESSKYIEFQGFCSEREKTSCTTARDVVKTETTKATSTDRSQGSPQPVIKTDTTRAASPERSQVSPQLDRSGTTVSPKKFKKSLVLHQYSQTLVNEKGSCGLSPWANGFQENDN